MASSRTPLEDGALPYWQINVPPSQREAECPSALRDLPVRDQTILSTPDSEYPILSWEEAQELVKANQINLFHRQPSQLRRYHFFSHHVRKKYGSLLNFILSQKLEWTEPVTPAGNPFEKEEDIKIVYNDWPYGIDERIVHLVIWTKFPFEEDDITGDLTPPARAEVNEYVQRVFVKVCGDENVIWFKNWASLKSIRALEHFHVMLFNPDAAFLDKITNGDVPLSRSFNG
ncbi:hypothetical protein BJ875DRAFT_480464 [Amylocarpus encephaloides]|uniref:N-acetylglucosamine-induced protein 1 n=1 Tax=Amylocarpus encephaloides TaxID=45428 RepID=A0A9P7YSD8_9HELO|nr:hypothetical protein BJ875DRAFT_480464 [Amylocarpus encephaloides]